MVTIITRYDGLSDEILQFDVERRLARVKACRGRMGTGLRQAVPSGLTAWRKGEEE